MMATLLIVDPLVPYVGLSGGGEDSCQGYTGGSISDRESTRSEWWSGAMGVPRRTFAASTRVLAAPGLDRCDDTSVFKGTLLLATCRRRALVYSLRIESWSLSREQRGKNVKTSS
jgi:hypothetical protein